MRTDVKGWGILLLLDPASLGGNCAFNDVVELFQGGLDLPVALGDLALINPVKLQRLGKFEDVFLTPVPLERSRYGLLVGPDPAVAVLGQLVCIPLTPDDVVDDRPSPVLPVTSLMTCCNFTFIWPRAFCMC